MKFEKEHAKWLRHHIQKRNGERQGRLARGHREAEKLFCQHIWWTLHGNFDDLHPEFEVLDWRGHSYYCDFAWLTKSVRLVIEIKGFGPHVRDMDRQKYCNELNRETFLTAMGYQVISFSYDDVATRPELCITLLRMLMSRFQTITSPVNPTRVMEREIIRLAYRLASPIRPTDVETHLNMNHRTVVRLLKSLCELGWFTPIVGADGKYVVRYQLQEGNLQHLFGF